MRKLANTAAGREGLDIGNWPENLETHGLIVSIRSDMVNRGAGFNAAHGTANHNPSFLRRCAKARSRSPLSLMNPDASR